MAAQPAPPTPPVQTGRVGTPPVKAAIVSYFNAEPMLRCLRGLPGLELLPAIPSRLPGLLESGAADIALLPVAALPRIAGARIACNWGIAADGPVASVLLVADVPMEQIEEVVLDWQSCTSVALVRLLLRGPWQRRGVRIVPAEPDYLGTLGGRRAGVVIGDRALACRDRFAHRWDLAEAWKAWTGLPFVFAAWASVRPLPGDFLAAFDAALAGWRAQVAPSVAAHPGVRYDLRRYYEQDLRFALDARMHAGLRRFMAELATLEPLPAPAAAAAAVAV